MFRQILSANADIPDFCRPALLSCVFCSCIIFSCMVLLSCKAIEIKDDENQPDFTPPKITAFEIIDSRCAGITFSKDVTVINAESSFEAVPDMQISGITAEKNFIKINFSNDQIPGTEYHIKGTVSDKAGNTLTFGARFYGFNPDIPDIIINEFTTQGSSTHPDMVEFFVREPGNTAGMVFYAGCSSEYDIFYVFPSVAVKSGDYIILHTKPQNIPEEIDETESKESSGGLDASPAAWDFWIKGGTGLSGNNGALSLYSSYGGRVLDAVLYSNRTSLSDENYRGFGSTAMMVKADCLTAAGGWRAAADPVRPEDCVNPDGSTATRSICRSSASADTDAAADWHTVPTSSYTFGSINSDAVYEP